jgi:hypothetical protein
MAGCGVWISRFSVLGLSGHHRDRWFGWWRRGRLPPAVYLLVLKDARMSEGWDHVSAALGVDFLAGMNLSIYEI